VSCDHATVIQGTTLGAGIIECGRLYGPQRRITFVVTSCSGYYDKSLPSLYHLESIAWILRTDTKRASVGFVRAKELPEDERHVLDE
jgi:hypothetical protein